MHIMPETWADLRLRHDLGDDPYNARDNILAGTAYLADLRDRYGAEKPRSLASAGTGHSDHRAAPVFGIVCISPGLMSFCPAARTAVG